MKTVAAVIRDTGEGERRWFCGGGMHTWKVTQEETGGAFLLYQFSKRSMEDLKRVFGYVGRRFQPLNLLPAYLFVCQLTTE